METVSRGSEYIVHEKLCGNFVDMQKRQKRDETSNSGIDDGKLLPQYKDARRDLVEAMLQYYQTDITLFGYTATRGTSGIPGLLKVTCRDADKGICC